MNRKNKDENTPNIMYDIVRAMTEVQQSIFVDGTSKKNFVMKILRRRLGEELFERYEPMLSVSIDFLKTLTKNKNMLDGLKRDGYSCLEQMVSCTII